MATPSVGNPTKTKTKWMKRLWHGGALAQHPHPSPRRHRMGKTVSFSSSRGDGDLYALLELGPECTAKEIKASYRRLAKRYHPDAPKGGDAERFKAIAKAYAILSREESRRKYDGGRRAWKQPWRAGASSAFDARNSSTTDFKDAFDTFGEKVRDAQKRDEEFYGLVSSDRNRSVRFHSVPFGSVRCRMSMSYVAKLDACNVLRRRSSFRLGSSNGSQVDVIFNVNARATSSGIWRRTSNRTRRAAATTHAAAATSGNILERICWNSWSRTKCLAVKMLTI